MKKQLLSALLITGLFSISSANAHDDLQFGKTTLSAGYSQIKMEGQNPMHGGVISLRQELNKQFGILATTTYAQNEYDLNKSVKRVLKDINTRYYSVMTGPTLRLNDYFSVYAVAGISQIQFKNIDKSESNKNKIKKNAFSWGAGIMINPTEVLSISLGYENSRYKFSEIAKDKMIIDGFIANVGYRF